MYPAVYKEVAPNIHLQQFIKCYWRFEKTYNQGEFEHVFPDSSYELVYGPGVTFVVDRQTVPEMYMVGQLKKPLDFYATGTVRHWAVRFYPWGLQPFADVQKMHNKEWLPASEILDEKDRAALTQAMAGHDEAQTVRLLDDFFIRRLLDWQFDDAMLDQIVGKLKAQKGVIKIKDLADSCYVSQRHLSRKLMRATGHSPHDVASRLRFEHVRDAIMHNPDVPLAFLAAQYGYTDQSHLVKEFRAYTDMTPTAYGDSFRQAQSRFRDRSRVLFLEEEASA